jgi:hypothetical protein
LTNKADITEKLQVKNTDTSTQTKLEISIAKIGKSLPYYLDHKTCLGFRRQILWGGKKSVIAFALQDAGNFRLNYPGKKACLMVQKTR